MLHVVTMNAASSIYEGEWGHLYDYCIRSAAWGAALPSMPVALAEHIRASIDAFIIRVLSILKYLHVRKLASLAR